MRPSNSRIRFAASSTELLMLAMVFAGGAALTAFFAVQLAASSKIEGLRATPDIVDAGSHVPGADVEAAVSLTNATSKPIQILSIQPSCDCAKYVLDAKTLEPDEQTQLKITWSLRPLWGEANTQVIVQYREAPAGDPRWLLVPLTATAESPSHSKE